MTVYDSWCVSLGAGHSCVNVAGPVAADARDAEDVLDHARFLVERLLDEERVVGDLEGLGCGSGGGGGGAGAAGSAPHADASISSSDDARPSRLNEHLRCGARADREAAARPPRSRTLSAASSRASTCTTWPGFSSCRSTNRRNSAS